MQELLQADLRKLQREANRVLEPAWGSDAAAFAALGARCVELQAVPAQGKCQVPGCSRDAVVLCSDCKPGGVLFCPRHDSEQHPFAHEHRRAALTSGFKHPLRPTQQYEDGQAHGQHRQQLRVHEQQQAGGQHASWPDVVKVFDLPPGRACGCANDSSAKHWVLQERSVQEQRKPLIVVGQSGRFDFCKAFYRCSCCDAGQWQSSEDFLRLGLYPASLDPANQTYVSEAQLQRMRETARLTVCSGRATARIIDGVGAAVYGQVHKVNPEALNNAFVLWRRVQHHLDGAKGRRTFAANNTRVLVRL
ncbi:hypothetical protein COO60DRAFT_561761 [Scenedesmus sp. NREL 46B-D3]|nr:hypothetical protein COO60DRAFT_561761 [Scenedesmus sp. NREL 46B-D3]